MRIRDIGSIGVVLLLAACGGGNGDDGGESMLLSGSYRFAAASAAVTPAVTTRTTWGTLVADGAGSLAATLWENRDSSADGPHDQTGIPYVVGSDRTLTIFDATTPGLVTAQGRLSAAGDIGVFSAVTDGEEPEAGLTLRQGGTFTEASVEAVYILCGWWRAATGPSALHGVISLDAGGSFVRTATKNTGGTTSSYPFTGTWSIQSDGRLRLWVENGAMLEGGFLPNGEVAVVGGGDVDGDLPILYVLVRENADRTATDQGGDYSIAGMEFDISAGEYVSATGSIAMNGAGVFDVQITRNEDGSIQLPQTDTGAYEVWADGTLKVTTSGGDDFFGAISLDGRFAMLGGGRTTGSSPLLYLFVK